MDVESTTKPEELGEEDLVDYEEEEDTAQAADKPAENGKDAPKKYATTTYPSPPHFFRSGSLPNMLVCIQPPVAVGRLLP